MVGGGRPISPPPPSQTRPATSQNETFPCRPDFRTLLESARARVSELDAASIDRAIGDTFELIAMLVRRIATSDVVGGNCLEPKVVDEETASRILDIDVGEMQTSHEFYEYARAWTHGKRRKYWQHLLGTPPPRLRTRRGA
jgi:hypothetical protein